MAVFFSIFALIFTLIRTCVKLFPNQSISRQCAAYFLRSDSASVVLVVAGRKRYARCRSRRDTGTLVVSVNRNVQGLLPTLLTIVLLSLQAVLINVLVSNHRLASEVSLFPGLFYILIASSLPDFLCFSPIHLANTFLIIALGILMATYKQSSCADLIFNVGLWLGVASLFYPPFLLFLFVGMAGLNVLRAYKIRERLMILAGMADPVFSGRFILFLEQRIIFIP